MTGFVIGRLGVEAAGEEEVSRRVNFLCDEGEAESIKRGFADRIPRREGKIWTLERRRAGQGRGFGRDNGMNSDGRLKCGRFGRNGGNSGGGTVGVGGGFGTGCVNLRWFRLGVRMGMAKRRGGICR